MIHRGFDCVEMKNKVQEKIMRKQTSWTKKNVLDYYDKIYQEMILKKKKIQASKRKVPKNKYQRVHL
jgi:hypothetical protein